MTGNKIMEPFNMTHPITKNIQKYVYVFTKIPPIINIKTASKIPQQNHRVPEIPKNF